MKIVKHLFFALACATVIANTSCDNTKSYAELLNEENQATNAFLVNQRIEASIPADTIFEVGPNAPYYQIDEDANVFMQVLNPGTPGNKVKYDQLIYFRFMRYSLYSYTYDANKANTPGYYGDLGTGEGNDSDLTYGSALFRFGNMSNTNSYQWGSGIQMPLIFLPIDCEVNLVVKSQLGLNNEIAQVTPYLYKIRYFKSQI